jgi:hypothetical protein
MLMVTSGGHVTLVETSVVVEVTDPVATIVEVDVAVSRPPKGAKRRIVESGVGMAGGTTTRGFATAGGTKVGDDPTIQASLEVIM